MDIITKTIYRVKTFDSIKRMSFPYIKFSLLGFTQWGDLNDDKVNEWRFLGFKI